VIDVFRPIFRYLFGQQIVKLEMKRHRVILVAIALALISADARAQAKALSLAYQVTHADQASPSVSPDGDKIVYAVSIAGKEQLFTMKLDGSESVQITHDPSNHDNPVWSPDGRTIAYASDKNGGEGIYIMDASGGSEVRLTDEQHQYIHPNWSSDGTKLIYCSTDDLHPPQKNPSEIYSINLKTREVRTLITGGINTYPSWSPDAKRIVFRKIIGDLNSEVFVANSDGTDQRNLSNNPAFDGWPAWSPDGTQIAFASNRDSNYKIFLMKADGSNVRVLAETEGRATEPRWSPDGKTVYFTNCYSVAWGTDCEVFAAGANPSQP
jgi:TolB protein